MKILTECLNIIQYRDNKDLNNFIDNDDKAMLNNKRVYTASIIDWGKTMAISNQYIQKNLLNLNQNIQVWSNDDADCPSAFDIANNSPGFDLLMLKDGKYYKIQSKLRQVKGKTDFSQQTHFETTRRNSIKNKDKNSTGHICYSSDEFDYVMVSLINVKNGIIDTKRDINKWSFSFIPVSSLLQKGNDTLCETKIKSNVLKKYQIENNDFTSINF